MTNIELLVRRLNDWGTVEAEVLVNYLHLAFKKFLINEYILLILRLLIRNNYNEILKI